MLAKYKQTKGWIWGGFEPKLSGEELTVQFWSVNVKYEGLFSGLFGLENPLC